MPFKSLPVFACDRIPQPDCIVPLPLASVPPSGLKATLETHSYAPLESACGRL